MNIWRFCYKKPKKINEKDGTPNNQNTLVTHTTKKIGHVVLLTGAPVKIQLNGQGACGNLLYEEIWIF